MNPNTERKERLVLEGMAYRMRLDVATRQVRHGLQPEVLAQGAAGLAGKTALGLFSGGGFSGIGLPSVLPLLLSGASMLVRKSGGRPIVRGFLTVAVAIGVAVAVIRAKKICPA